MRNLFKYNMLTIDKCSIVQQKIKSSEVPTAIEKSNASERSFYSFLVH